jgi:hypothetical protein
MVKSSVVGLALVLGASALSGCAAVGDGGGAPFSGWAEEGGLEPELAFAEPGNLAFGPTAPDLIREPASSADLALRPDFDPMIDAIDGAPLDQDGTEAAGHADGGGREVVTDVFDDSLMTDDGVLPSAGEEGRLR